MKIHSSETELQKYLNTIIDDVNANTFLIILQTFDQKKSHWCREAAIFSVTSCHKCYQLTVINTTMAAQTLWPERGIRILGDGDGMS